MVLTTIASHPWLCGFAVWAICMAFWLAFFAGAKRLDD